MMRRALGDAGDRAAFSPENRALVAVLVHRLDFSGVPIGRIADAMEVELAKNSNMEKISRDDLWGRTRGIVLHNRITEGKGKAELVQALVLRGKIFYTVQMTVPSETYERANAEFKKMLEEFDPRDVVELAQPTFDTSPTPGPPSVFEPQSQLPTHDFTKTSERRVNANP